MDVSQEQQVVDLFNTIDARLGSLTGLVNNAGILLPQMSVEQMDALIVYLLPMLQAIFCAVERPLNAWH